MAKKQKKTEGFSKKEKAEAASLLRSFEKRAKKVDVQAMTESLVALAPEAIRDVVRQEIAVELKGRRDTDIGFEEMRDAIERINDHTTREDVVRAFVEAAHFNNLFEVKLLAAAFPYLTDLANPYLVDALHSACNGCYIETARILVEDYRADVNAVVDQERGMTALHEALNSGDSEIVRMLVKNGADVNARMRGAEDFGNTAVHFAAGNRSVVEFLVENGADLAVKNDKGQTPADLARQEGCSKAWLKVLDELTAKQIAAKQTPPAAPKTPKPPKL